MDIKLIPAGNGSKFTFPALPGKIQGKYGAKYQSFDIISQGTVRIGGELSMYYQKDIQRTAEKEFLASDKVVAFTGTVVPDGVEADTDGRKIVHKGSLMAASGTVVSLTASSGGVSFTGKPAGLLMETVDVTYGAQPGAFMKEGYVIGERLPLGVEYTEAVGEAIHAKLPEIKFVEKESE